VKYELGSYIPDDGVLHSNGRENLKSNKEAELCVGRKRQCLLRETAAILTSLPPAPLPFCTSLSQNAALNSLQVGVERLPLPDFSHGCNHYVKAINSHNSMQKIYSWLRSQYIPM
jgi:hypothetical protein